MPTHPVPFPIATVDWVDSLERAGYLEGRPPRKPPIEHQNKFIAGSEPLDLFTKTRGVSKIQPRKLKTNQVSDF